MILQAVFVYFIWFILCLLFLMDLNEGGKPRCRHHAIFRIGTWLTKNGHKYNFKPISFCIMGIVTVGVTAVYSPNVRLFGESMYYLKNDIEPGR